MKSTAPKRPGPTEFLQGLNPKSEYLFAKVPGGLENIAVLWERFAVFPDYIKILELIKSGYINGGRTDIHNHSTIREWLPTLPGQDDVRGLFLEPLYKCVIVAQHNPKTSIIEGYFFLRKTKRTPKIPPFPLEVLLEQSKRIREKGSSSDYVKSLSEEEKKRILKVRKEYENLPEVKNLLKDIEKYASSENSENNEEHTSLKELEAICRKYCLQFRAVPAKGFIFDKKRARFIKKEN